MTELTKDEQVLYDFFMTFGKAHDSIDYPIAVLAVWTCGDEEDGIVYNKKQAVLDAYTKPDVFCLLYTSPSPRD